VSLTVLMPALNEQESIETAVLRVRSVLEHVADEFEIVVMNDGSTDRTGEIALRLAAQDTRIRVVHSERNRNYGITLQRGIRDARCEWIVHDGADLPLAPEDFPNFIAHFDTADVIVARRTSLPGYTRWRLVTSHVYSRMVHALFRSAVVDKNFTQFFRRSFAQSIRFVTTSPSVTTPELILRAEHTGKRVIEIVADFQRRDAGAHHFGKPKDIAWTALDLLRLRWHTLWHGWEG
jgi:glycosyltransferase involved in cell wall biosynthesis